MNTAINTQIKIKGNEFILNSFTIPDFMITPEMIEIFIIGYKDAINSRFDSKCYRRVNKIEFFEEFMYIEGYRYGGLDARIGLTTLGNIDFDETYKESIKLSLQVCDFDDMLDSDIKLLDILIEENK